MEGSSYVSFSSYNQSHRSQDFNLNLLTLIPSLKLLYDMDHILYTVIFNRFSDGEKFLKMISLFQPKPPIPLKSSILMIYFHHLITLTKMHGRTNYEISLGYCW